MTDQTTITEAEMHLMQALWDRHPLNAAEIAASVRDITGWHRKTVNTLLSRLVKKGALSFEEHPAGRRYVPLIDRDAYTGAVARDVVGRLFGGRLAPLIAHFAHTENLSAADVAEIESILEDLKNDD